MRFLYMFMVLFHCHCILKRKTDVSERVYGLGRGPWLHECVGFGVGQAAGSPRFQLNDGVLRRKMRLLFVFMVLFHCHWVSKGRADVSERVYGLGRGPGKDPMNRPTT